MFTCFVFDVRRVVPSSFREPQGRFWERVTIYDHTGRIISQFLCTKPLSIHHLQTGLTTSKKTMTTKSKMPPPNADHHGDYLAKREAFLIRKGLDYLLNDPKPLTKINVDET